jgi:asparagine synthase (glutamine-hydrolysing)
MCGISGVVGRRPTSLEASIESTAHRGPDDTGSWMSSDCVASLGHNRLSIIDLSPSGHQPMADASGRFQLVFNGEIYNYSELRAELAGYPFRSRSDSEVILAAYSKWGDACLDRFIGMFSLAIWDAESGSLFAARDRFGVKPFYYSIDRHGALAFASEIKALHALGVPRKPDEETWASYFVHSLYDHGPRTFWQGISSLPAGHLLKWNGSGVTIRRWYDLADRVAGDYDTRPDSEVADEYLALMEDSIRLRFRADVPVGINLSGGLDSSILLGLVNRYRGASGAVNSFTFATGDDRYDELPWVKEMLAGTSHPHHICSITAEEVPSIAAKVQSHQDEPFGGLPTLAYSQVFRRARELGVIVLLDGQGLDEQWAGYEYYLRANDERAPKDAISRGPVQGSSRASFAADCLLPEFRSQAVEVPEPRRFPDRLRNVQLRDAEITKIPRALRFNDRVSMMYSCELREPFLDHRLFELAFRQPSERKIRGGTRKWLLREIAADLLPRTVREAPKRALQTPQREWLRGPLAGWAESNIECALSGWGSRWLDADAVRAEWTQYLSDGADNSFPFWQWINLGLMTRAA